jgi:hypothetical protein
MIFEDQKHRNMISKDHKFRLYGENIKSTNDRDEFLYSFKNFLEIFKTD